MGKRTSVVVCGWQLQENKFFFWTILVVQVYLTYYAYQLKSSTCCSVLAL
jgi:hypothetical protein